MDLTPAATPGAAESAPGQGSPRPEDSPSAGPSTLADAWDALEVGIAVCDARGHLVSCNPSLPCLLALDPKQFRRHPPSPLCSVGFRESGERFSEETDPLLLALRTGLPLSRVMLRVPRAGGGATWLSVSSRPLPGAAGAGPSGVVASFTDVTQERLNLEALREGEARFRALADSAPVLIWAVNRDGGVVYVNRRWTELTGRLPGAERDDGWIVSIHPEDREDCLAAFSSAVRDRRPFTLEMRLRRGDGVYRWTLHHGAPRLDASGVVAGFIVSGVDIDLRRRAEARQAAMLAATRVFLEQSDPADAIPRLLEAVGRGLGYQHGEFWLAQGAEADRMHWWHHHPPVEGDAATWPGAEPPASGTEVVRVLQGRSAVVDEGRASGPEGDGSSGRQGVLAVPVRIGGTVGGVLLFRAISDHLLAEDLEVMLDLAGRLGQFLDLRLAVEHAREAEALRSSILDGIPARLALLDERGVVLAANPAWKEPPDGVRTLGGGVPVGASYLEALQADAGTIAGAVATGIRQVMAGEAPGHEQEYAVAGAGDPCWYRLIVSPLVRGRTRGAIVMHLDVTAAKRATAALRASETRYRLLSQVTSDVIYEWDVVHDRVDCSEGLIRTFGYDSLVHTSAWWKERIHPEDRPRVSRSLADARDGASVSWVALYRFQRADGSWRIVADRGYLVRDEARRLVRMIGAMSDITDRREAEERLRRSEAVLAAAQAVAQLGSWEWDLRSGEAWWSAQLYRILGLPVESGSTPNVRLLEYVHPEDRPLVAQQLAAVAGEARAFDLEFRIVRPDGTTRHAHARGHPVGFEGDPPTTAIGAMQDVTELREAERTLRERKERLRLLHSLAGSLPQTRSVTEVVAEVVAQLQQCLPSLRVSYGTIGPEAELRVLACRAPAGLEDLTGMTLDLSQAPEFLTGLRERREVILTDMDADPNLERFRRGRVFGTRAALFVGLHHGGPLVGLLGFASPTPREWSEHERALLQEVADWLRVRIVEARTEEERERSRHELAVSRQELRELANRLERAREEERTRIAREMHDSLGQLLTALYMEVGLLLQRRPADQHQGPALLQLIDHATETVRRLATDLRPSQLDDLGLTAALEWELERFETRYGVRCECDLRLTDSSLTPEQSTAMFRVLQEALTNTARHARASRVCVLLRGDEDWVILDVADDGVGIPEPALQDSTSLGLIGMRERALAQGGRLEVHSEPGRGTVLSLVLPRVRTAGAGPA